MGICNNRLLFNGSFEEMQAVMEGDKVVIGQGSPAPLTRENPVLHVIILNN